MAAGRFSVEAVFKAIDKITAPVSRMQNRVGKFTRKMGNDLRRLNKQTAFFGKSFKTALGVAGIAGGLFLMQSAMLSTIQTGVEFEQTLTNASAKFPEGIRKGTEAFRQLEDAARRVGATTEFTASQAAGGLNFLAMAGFNAKQSIAALPAVVDLATASGMDLARATDIASDTLGAFNLATKDSAQLTKNLTRINDVLAKTVTTANTDMEQLFETIKLGGPVATAAGASIETFAAAAGVLANSGIKATVAGTTLKNVFVRLAAPVGKASKLLKKLGVDTKDSQGNMRDVFDIFQDLDKSLVGLGSADKLGVLEEIFGKIPLAGVNVLLSKGADGLREYRKELENSTGAAAKMAAIMRDTLGGQLKEAKSATEGLQLTIFSQLVPAFKSALAAITPFIRGVSAFMEENRFIIPVILSTIKALTLLAIVFGTVKLAIMGITFAMALNPFGLIVISLVALIALLPVLIRNWDQVAETMRGVAAFWTEVFFEGIELVKKGVLELIEILKNTTLVKGIELAVGLVKVGARGIGAALGLGGKEGEPPEDRQVVSPEERMVRRIETSSSVSKTELRIKDDTGRGELEGTAGPGVQLVLADSGAF